MRVSETYTGRAVIAGQGDCRAVEVTVRLVLAGDYKGVLYNDFANVVSSELLDNCPKNLGDVFSGLVKSASTGTVTIRSAPLEVKP